MISFIASPHLPSLAHARLLARAAAVPHLQVEEVEVGRAHDRADCGYRLGGVDRTLAEWRKLLRAVLRLGGIEPDCGREHPLQALVRHRLRLAVRERVVDPRAERRDAVVLRGRGRAHAGLARALIRPAPGPAAGAPSCRTSPAAPRARTAAPR